MRAGSKIRWVGLATSTRPTARVPTTTRWDWRSSVTRYEALPRTNRAAITIGTDRAKARTFSSVTWNRSPTIQQKTATATTAQPIGETTFSMGCRRRIHSSTALRSEERRVGKAWGTGGWRTEAEDRQ